MPAPHPPECRRRAVELARERTMPIVQLSRKFGISEMAGILAHVGGCSATSLPLQRDEPSHIVTVPASRAPGPTMDATMRRTIRPVSGVPPSGASRI